MQTSNSRTELTVLVFFILLFFSQVVLQKLPDLERNIFLYLCMFLQELVRYSNDNGFDAKTLALIFGDILLRDPIRNSKPQASRGKVSFIHNFLVNDLSGLIVPNK